MMVSCSVPCFLLMPKMKRMVCHAVYNLPERVIVIPAPPPKLLLLPTFMSLPSFRASPYLSKTEATFAARGTGSCLPLVQIGASASSGDAGDGASTSSGPSNKESTQSGDAGAVASCW